MELYMYTGVLTKNADLTRPYSEVVQVQSWLDNWLDGWRGCDSLVDWARGLQAFRGLKEFNNRAIPLNLDERLLLLDMLESEEINPTHIFPSRRAHLMTKLRSTLKPGSLRPGVQVLILPYARQ